MTQGSGLRFDVMPARDRSDFWDGLAPSCLLYRELLGNFSDVEVDWLESPGRLLCGGAVVVVSIMWTSTPATSKRYRLDTGARLLARHRESGYGGLQVIGFGYPPRRLSRAGLWAKELPSIGRILDPLWRKIDDCRAHTPIVLG